MKKQVIIVGAGPEGLSSAMIFAHRGFDVTVVEKTDRVGDEDGYRRFMNDHAAKLRAICPCLQNPYHKLTSYLRSELLKVIPYIATTILGNGRISSNLLYDAVGKEYSRADLAPAFL